MRHIMAKLHLAPGSHVLDIGSGWGALATTIAEATDATVTGITLSWEQLTIAQQRADRRGIAARVDFQLLDYRDVTGTYDRIVSVGMLEHVGRDQLVAYFAKVAALLADDGVALIHSIGSAAAANAGPHGDNGWLNRYIFPGGYIPSLSEAIGAAERAGLWVTDVEVLRLHYAETLRCWWSRFQARRDEAVELMGERACRMWEYYLASSEAGFRNRQLMVFQLQVTRRPDAVPLTRDYIYGARERLEGRREPDRPDSNCSAAALEQQGSRHEQELV